MHAAALALVVAGTAIVVASAVAALAAPDTYTRIHYTTPVTSLGSPLIGLGLSVGSGLNLTTASVLMPIVLLFFCGPILTAAIGRAVAQHEGRISSESPE